VNVPVLCTVMPHACTASPFVLHQHLNLMVSTPKLLHTTPTTALLPLASQLT
jgi:hypothetical protein